MDKYSFDFNPKDCNKMYFKELMLLLNSIDPEKEDFSKMSKNRLKKLKVKCEHEMHTCKTDEFFFENKKQVVLGRFFDTFGCFYSCKEHFFTSTVKEYSLFKNDVVIRYMIDKPELYITDSEKIELEHVFPIRILLSEEHNIPTYNEIPMKNIEEFTTDIILKKIAVSEENLKIINELPESSLLKKLITDKISGGITSRELCILHQMKLYFYVVENNDKSIKPFILVSKYNIHQLKKLYKKYHRDFPNMHYLFTKNKTYKNKSHKHTSHKHKNKTHKLI